MLLQVKSRKGISVMIGYVILITIAIVMGTIIFTWLKTYVPNETSKCPDGTSIYLKDFVYDCRNSLNITIKNNGRFSLTGFYIHAANASNQELAAYDISPYLMTGDGYEGFKMNAWVKFNTGSGLTDENTLVPTEEINHTFQLPDEKFGPKLYFIELTPALYETENGKIRFFTCSNSRIRQAFTC